MSATYSELLVRKLLPEWAKDEFSLKLFGVVFGLNCDMLAEQKLVAATAGLIASPTSPDDSLPYVATERGGLWKYPIETMEQWRNRLINAASAWEYAGGSKSIVDQLEAAGYPGCYLYYPDTSEGPHGQDAPYASQYWLAVPSSVCPDLVPAVWDEMFWGYFWWDVGALPVEFVRLCVGITSQFGDPTAVCRGVVIV